MSSSSSNNDELGNWRPPAVFDVSGTTYTVEWEILERHPTSLLTTSARLAAADTALPATTHAVVVKLDRGAATFPSLLQYLRRPPADDADDDEFWLPPSLTSAEFLQDLNYFGIDIGTSKVRSGVDNFVYAEQARTFHNWNGSYVNSLLFKKVMVQVELDCARLAYKLLCETHSGVFDELDMTWPRHILVMRDSHETLYNAMQYQNWDSAVMVTVRETLQKYGLCIVVCKQSGKRCKVFPGYAQFMVQPLTARAQQSGVTLA